MQVYSLKQVNELDSNQRAGRVDGVPCHTQKEREKQASTRDNREMENTRNTRNNWRRDKVCEMKLLFSNCDTLQYGGLKTL